MVKPHFNSNINVFAAQQTTARCLQTTTNLFSFGNEKQKLIQYFVGLSSKIEQNLTFFMTDYLCLSWGECL